MQQNISLALASIALILSAFTLYRSYFYTKIDLIAVVLDHQWDSEKNNYILKILYFNNGTRSEVISGLNLNFHIPDENFRKKHVIEYYIDLGYDPFTILQNPVTISGKSIEIKEYIFHLNESKLREAKDKFCKDDKTTILACLKFQVILHDGYTYTKIYSRGLTHKPGYPTDLPSLRLARIDLRPNPIDKFILRYEKRKQRI